VRRTGGRALLVVVPRLVVSLTAGGKVVPVGDGTWTDTRIALPPEVAAREWHNILTGDQVTAESDGEQPTVRLAKVLDVFPVGILEAEL
jgi:maltooligosyltrehalose synthase